MMDDASQRERISRLVFAAPALSEALMSGNFRSAFKGRGMDFDSIREYEVTDDALRIDWNATARFGRPFVKTYMDDRDLSLYLIVDESASMNCGTGRTKHETASLAASLLAYACSLNGVRVGACFFGGTVELDSRAPQGGQRAALALMERCASGPGADGRHAGSDLAGALAAAASVLKRRSLVLVIGDFLTTGYALPLALLARRNDVIAIRVHDPIDAAPPETTLSIRAGDSESGVPRLVVPRSRAYRDERSRFAKAARLEWLVALSASRVPYLEMDASTDPVDALVTFFGRRRSA
ncbi:MAG TPA: DUF58 domain-containing protein [bacterium]|nr:DUF58 domain-containing protein [bacterium]